MKRKMWALLALVMCIILSACGKSKEVKNVEKMIEGVCSDSFNNWDMIKKVENAYMALAPSEKAKVSNYSDLRAAKTLFYNKRLIGNWRTERTTDTGLQEIFFQDNGTGFEYGTSFQWRIADDTIEVVSEDDSRDVAVFEIFFQDGFMKLRIKPKYEDEFEEEGYTVLVKSEDYDAAYNLKYVTFHFENSSVESVIGPPVFLYAEDGTDYYRFSNLLYDKGLVYFGCSKGFDLDAEWYFNGYKSEMIDTWKEPPFSVFGNTDDTFAVINKRATGELYFVRNQYVIKNDLFCDEYNDWYRIVVLDSGERFVSTAGWTPSLDYVNYKY